MCNTSTRTLLGNTVEKQTPVNQDQELSFVKKQRCLKNVVFYGCLSLASLIVGASLSYPFYQSRRDDLGCDTLCFGAMTSTRSFLSLIGSTILGRISDSPRVGRMTCLYIGVVSSVVGFSVSIVDSNSIKGMWLSILPASLFQQNYSILKALFSDFHEDLLNVCGDNDSSILAVTQSRANSAGKLGMSVGFAFMIGSFVGGTMLRSYEESIYYSIIFTALSGFFLWMIPPPHLKPKNIQTKSSINSAICNNQKTSSSWMKQKILAQIDALPLSCLFILLLRVLMALAYNIFNTIWTVSLKRRFNFGPKQHGKFMAFVGFAYAIAQGYVAKQVIGKFQQKKHRKYLIMICCVVLGLGRWYGCYTTNVTCLYAVFTGIYRYCDSVGSYEYNFNGRHKRRRLV